MSVLAAVILCDRKASSQLVALPNILAAPEIGEIHVNIETRDTSLFRDLEEALVAGGKPFTIETWHRDGWIGSRPVFDQDQKRLMYIVTARNMVIDYALSNHFDHLLFVDADVQIEPDGLKYLIALEQPLCGGLVPGRGGHTNIHYVLPSDYGMFYDGPTIKCGCGSCGYMLIHRSIFSRLRFRWGLDQQEDGNWLSEDPAYCQDARYLGLSDAFHIDTRATAKHWDDPEHPLTSDQECIENVPGKQ
jgi:hypothetical protein